MAASHTPYPTGPHRRFLSLKWKALLWTSMVLVLVSVAISWRSYSNLVAQFDRHRQSAYEGNVKEVQALLEQSLDRLRQLGSIVPSLPGMQQSLADMDLDSIRQAFMPQWPVLQFDIGVDVARFYDRSGSLLASWEVGGWNSTLDRHSQEWVAQVNVTESPVRAVSCEPTCKQYAVVPILARGQSAGALLLGSSMADLVRSFQQVSGNDIGLIVHDAQGNLPAERRIGSWGVRLDALTNLDRNLDVVRLAAHQASLEQAARGVRLAYLGRSFEVRLIPLPQFAGDNTAHLVVIADITDTLAQIRESSQELLIGGISGWLLAEVLLLLVLWTPMSRLRDTARNLPLLAQGRFKVVRNAIERRAAAPLINDEIDVLDSTTVALSDRLEALEQKVEDRTRALSRRMEELSAERDFVSNLLDTAQVMIFTLDRRGVVLMANLFAQDLTGYHEEELVGLPFIGLLAANELSSDIRQQLEELNRGNHSHLRHESVINCASGDMRNITWYHSWLEKGGPDEAVVLSVGLDITERRGAESRLDWLSAHDPLTGLLNRHRFQEELDMAINTAQRQGKSGGLLLIDLDQFKYINDTSGHHSGDALLKVVASTLSERVVSADVVSRLGGDEFAILLRDSDRPQAVQVARQVNALLGGVGIPHNGQTQRVSASIGVAVFPEHAGNATDLLACADLAMYRAKDEGRGNFHLFSDEDNTREQMHDRMYWKDRVSQALAEDGFMLFYQPIMDIRSGALSHYEVLLRMSDADGSIISAVHFIDAAERSGMIHTLDRMVLSKAIEHLAEVHRRGFDVSFSINLSGHAFSDPELLPHIKRELQRTRVDTSKVIFEITETAAVSDFAVATNLMLAIKALGCRFALDDFGIGFSSFYYLKHLPVDYLKIDGSFIRQLSENPDDRTIVKALAQVAAGFGKRTIAEYVETRETLELLRRYGIDYAQGYYISKAVRAEEAFPDPDREGGAISLPPVRVRDQSG